MTTAEPRTSMTSLLEGYSSAVPIYEGAETIVYRARAKGTGARVIIKMTKNEYPAAKEVARLRRELSILRELSLPHIPKAHGIEEQGRAIALVMDDLGETTLRVVLNQQRLSIEDALSIAISLSEVLSEVHRRRIIHKDITPRNIVVDVATMQAYLIDFGISARLAQEVQTAGGLSVLEGTLVYIAPEQTGRMNRAVDLRADLYSLGAVLYEMLAGFVPFQAETPAELIHSHLARRPQPPHERFPSVPEPLSDIVMTLLAKTPEERYQSDAGLKADLEECLRQLKATGTIAPFPLRRRDKATEIRRPQQLYGRERDVAALVQAFERVAVRGPELCLVSGYSGIGKSALVNEIHKLTAHKGGYFAAGKFDQISRDTPLAPVVHAFRELILQILTEPVAELAEWKIDLLEALGEHGQLIIDLIPELELIIGPQPEPPALSSDQARNRFQITLQNFVDLFAGPAHPLVIFLDDLQWIDPASLSFLKLLLVDAYSENVLLIGAYRDNEVALGHPLLTMLEELSRAGLPITDIKLSPLDAPMVRRFVADTLTSREDEVEGLADLVFERTQGNPFFVHQFLVTLNEQDLLRFDAGAGEWRWDIAQIRGTNATDNVVDLMVKKLLRLAAPTQKALMLAACIGFQFDLRSLSLVAESSLGPTATALWQAMREGLIIPLDNDYRLLEGMSEGAQATELPVDFNVRYRFLHDRILHAAYSLVDADHKQQLHLSIGRLLRRRSGEDARDEDVLEIVRHLNLGAAGITDHAEAVDLARLNLRAGRRARAATAFKAAAGYFGAGIKLLRDEDWKDDFSMCFALHLEGAECEFLSGSVEGAEALFNAAMPRTRTDVDRVAIWEQRARIKLAQSQYAEGLRICCEGLTLLGQPLTMEELVSPEVMMREIGALPTNLGDRRIEDLIDSPELLDPAKRAMFELLDAMWVPAFYLTPIAFTVVAFMSANLAMKHGHTNRCAVLYGACAYTLTLHTGRVAEGLALFQLALDLNNKFPNPMQSAGLYQMYGSAYLMKGSLREAAQYHSIAVQRGVESGDFTNMAIGAYLASQVELFAGDPLDEALASADKRLALCRRTKETLPTATMTLVRQDIACLAGRTRSRTSLSDDSFNEEAYIESHSGPEYGNSLFHHYIQKIFIHYIFGEQTEAMAIAAKAHELYQFGGEDPSAKLCAFCQCIVLLAAPPPKDAEEAAQRAARFEDYKKRLDFSAASSKAAFLHMKILVEAEEARVAGEVDKAIRLYDEAIRLSHDYKAPNFEALACELAAKFYLSIGVVRVASALMKDAFRAYLHWGARSKAEALEDEYSQVLPMLRRESTRTKSTTTKSGEVTNTHSTILGRTTLGSLRDAALVLKAAQAIAGEIDLPKVIERLSSLVLENAGAERGYLILSRDGELVVSAVLGEGSHAIDQGHGKPLSQFDGLARSVVLYAARTQDQVVLDDAAAATRFAEDPHIKSAAPKSLLCLPLLNQARLSGILYLENRATAGIFNAARVELLALLSSQAAIAIENARLISSVRAANSEVQRANERLEQDVARRTEELGRANKELTGAKDRLELELANREEIERERTTLQEQVINAQRARLLELSTPLIPITDEVVVMPLIGTLDRDRAQQVLAAALEGAQRHRAKFVILDITGIQQIDTSVAGTLIGVAGALRLLGTQAVLTGIAPNIAQTLVGLGVELQSFVTMGTLQSGMAYALQRVRKSQSSGGARGSRPR